MKLRRTFIDAKRLSTTCLNYVVRSTWLLDYVKSITKPLEYTNSSFDKKSKELSEYVLYSSQKQSLKVFLDDNYDIVENRSYITENTQESLALYGYLNSDGEYVIGNDPNRSGLYGYSPFLGDNPDYILETDPTPQILYGYNIYLAVTSLQDGNGYYIKDADDLFIYTSDPDYTSNYYEWYLERRGEVDIIFWLHNSVYDLMTEQQKSNLLSKLARYVPAPYTYNLDKF